MQIEVDGRSVDELANRAIRTLALFTYDGNKEKVDPKNLKENHTPNVIYQHTLGDKISLT